MIKKDECDEHDEHDEHDECDVHDEFENTMKIILNVGGVKYETTFGTLNDCKGLSELILQKMNNIDDDDVINEIFIDRDPEVFKHVLKFLRGYPNVDYLLNDDVVYELIYWKHKFVDQKICKCINESIKVFKGYDSDKSSYTIESLNFENIETPTLTNNLTNINTPDISHLNEYKDTHYLIPLKVSKILNVNSPIECEVVCSEGWVDHVWVDKKLIKNLLYKLKLNIMLNSSIDHTNHTDCYCIC